MLGCVTLALVQAGLMNIAIDVVAVALFLAVIYAIFRVGVNACVGNRKSGVSALTRLTVIVVLLFAAYVGWRTTVMEANRQVCTEAVRVLQGPMADCRSNFTWAPQDYDVPFYTPAIGGLVVGVIAMSFVTVIVFALTMLPISWAIRFIRGVRQGLRAGRSRGPVQVQARPSAMGQADVPCPASSALRSPSTEQKSTTMEWAKRLAQRLIGAIAVCVLLLILSSSWLPDPGEHVGSAVLIYFVAAIVAYLMLRSCWRWKPMPLMRRVGALLLGGVIVVVGWLYLDSGPIASFGPSMWAMQNCIYYQKGPWEHRFTMAPAADGTCPYCEHVASLTDKHGRVVLGKDGQPIIVRRWMGTCQEASATNTTPAAPPVSTPALKTAAVQGAPGATIQPTPRPPVELSPETVEHIRSSVGNPGAVLPDLQGLLRHVFGSDVGKFELATNGPGELTLKGDEAFLYFCKAHACPDHQGVLVINLSDSKAAGAIVDQGSVYTYDGDYATDGSLPESLKSWLKENTQP